MYFGSFWHAFGYLGGQSSLDTLLSKDNVTLEDILNEDNILQEIKSGAQKFSDHMISNSDKLERLIEFVINEPDVNEGIDTNICYKYPFIASEIFSAQPPKIASFLLDELEQNENENENENDNDNQDNSNRGDDDNQQEDKDGKQDQEETNEWDIFKTKDMTQTTMKNNFFEGEENKDQEKENKETDEEQKEEANEPDPEEETQKVQQQDSQEPEEEQEPQSSQEKEDNTTSEPSEEQKEPEVAQKEEEQQAAEQTEENKEQKQDEQNNEQEPEKKEDKLPEEFDEIEDEPQIEQKPKKKGKELLYLLLSFILQDGPLNATSAGYFQKAIFMLIQKSGSFFNFLIQNPQYTQALIKHTQNRSICEIIVKLLLIEGTDKNEIDEGDQKKDIEDPYSEQRNEILRALFQTFSNSDDEEQLENISNIFIEIIQTVSSNDRNSNHFYDHLGVEIYENANLSILIDKMKSQNNSAIFLASSILNQIILLFVSRIAQSKAENTEDDEVNFETPSEKQNYPIDFFIDHFNVFMDCLCKGIENQSERQATYGGNQVISDTKDQKLSNQSVTYQSLRTTHYVTLFAQAIYSVSVWQIFQQIIKNHIKLNLQDVMVKFEWNNMLHLYVDRIIKNTLDQDNQKLKNNLFKDGDLVKRIIDIFESDSAVPGKCQTNVKRGYMGFFISIAKYMLTMEGSEGVSEYLQQNEQWQEFRDGKLTEALTTENQTLGGNESKKQNSFQDDQDDTNMDLDIQRIYAKFHNYFNNSKAEEEKEQDNNQNDDFPQQLGVLTEQGALPFSNIKPQDLDYDEAHYLNQMSSSYWKSDRTEFSLEDILANDVVE